MKSSETARIMIKINDGFFLNEGIYKSFENHLIVHPTFFDDKNLEIIKSLYPELKSNVSDSIFENLLNKLSGLSNSLTDDLVLESAFSIIDNTGICNLMLEAFRRTDFIGRNILNFFFVKTSKDKVDDTFIEIKSMAISGIDEVYIGGELADFNFERAASFIPSSSINDEVIADIDKLFNSFGVNGYNSNNTRIVDVEEGWDFNNRGIRRLNLGAKPILGGGFNFNSTSFNNHGTKTLNVLFGEEIPPNNSTLNGLCSGNNISVASVWFDANTKNYEAALASLFQVKYNANGKRVENDELLLNVGDIVLLELQITIRGHREYFPIEIEPANYAIIKLGIEAGFIIIEAAGNGGYDLDNHVKYYEDYMDLTANYLGTGAIMVGAVKKFDAGPPIKHPETNYGERVDCYYFGNTISTLTGMSFGFTSLATAIIAALAANLQKRARDGGRILSINDMKYYLKPISYHLFGIENTSIKYFNLNTKNTIKMRNEEKLSHQGIRQIKFKHTLVMKDYFKKDFIDRLPGENNDGQITDNGTSQSGLLNTGYFIGKVLLNRILTENEDAAGIIFSFGLDKPVEKGGQLQLVLEVASGIELDHIPNFIRDREVFATFDPDAQTPDGLIPAIKPTPPPAPPKGGG